MPRFHDLGLRPRRLPARRLLLCGALVALLSGCAGEPSPTPEEGDGAVAAAGPAAAVQPGPGGGAAGEGPPPGRYVCRQYTTTMGYLTLEPGGAYEVSGVRGRYRFDAQTGALEWEGGSYDEWNWEGRYEKVTRPEGDGRPDEEIIRLTSEADGLKIDCYRMAE